MLEFLRSKAAVSRFVTSVCTGSLVLGAAGLLRGYRATCHWMSLPQLELMGAIPVQGRVVFDGNRVTGAGVTSGIDFALALMAQIHGDDRAKAVQLGMEYDPRPPFREGSPAAADQSLIDQLRRQSSSFKVRRGIKAGWGCA